MAYYYYLLLPTTYVVLLLLPTTYLLPHVLLSNPHFVMVAMMSCHAT